MANNLAQFVGRGALAGLLIGAAYFPLSSCVKGPAPIVRQDNKVEDIPIGTEISPEIPRRLSEKERIAMNLPKIENVYSLDTKNSSLSLEKYSYSDGTLARVFSIANVTGNNQLNNLQLFDDKIDGKLNQAVYSEFDVSHIARNPEIEFSSPPVELFSHEIDLSDESNKIKYEELYKKG